jgi:DNA polymerase-3 subunit delta
MDYNSLLRDINAGKLEKAYLFWGEEDYLIEEIVKQIITKAIAPEAVDFNLDTFYGNEVDGARVLQAASAYPFLGERRVVIVKELQKMSQTDIEVINRYLTKPSPATCLILVAAKLNFTFKANKELKKNCVSIEFKELYERQIPGWIKQFLESKKIEIVDDAVRLLHENVGNSLRAIENELGKVILNLGGRKRIESDDVRQVVGLSRGYSVFDLSNLVGQKKLGAALSIISRMIESGESPIGILAMITRQFSVLLKLKFALKKGTAPVQLASVAGVPGIFIHDYLAQAKNYTVLELQQAFTYLLEADVQLKSSGQKPRLILELLVYNLVRH